MKSVGSYEAKTHLPQLLSEVEKGETITITKRGKPIAVLSPARAASECDVAAVIAEFRAYSREQARKHGPLSPCEIKEMIEEGRFAHKPAESPGTVLIRARSASA